VGTRDGLEAKRSGRYGVTSTTDPVPTTLRLSRVAVASRYPSKGVAVFTSKEVLTTLRLSSTGYRNSGGKSGVGSGEEGGSSGPKNAASNPSPTPNPIGGPFTSSEVQGRGNP
jgi:hypothetical protein